MKKILFWCLVPAFAIVSSCKKDTTSPPPPPAEKFMSLTAGSTWNYKFTNNPSTTPVSSNYAVSATSRDTTANGKTYRVFSNTAGANEYYNITGSDYYTFRSLQTSFIDTSLEVLYLKDNLDVNGTWKQDFGFSVDFFGTSIPLTLSFNNKIAQKGITKTVNGVTYTDVTDVETTLSLAGSPVPVTLTSNIHYYYAPKVGQIENKTVITFSATGITPTNIDQKTELQSATIL